MTRKDRINNDYFEWMFDLVCRGRYHKDISYRKLLMHLHNMEFVYTIPKDGNRAEDGLSLRYRFAISQGDKHLSDYLEGPCSVLEMILALAIRCEEDVMDDPGKGDRTGQWFWGMITNLGLGYMMDDRFDKLYVNDIITRFLDRRYERDGRGGLFTIRNCRRDLRKVEIWVQLCWYLDNIT